MGLFSRKSKPRDLLQSNGSFNGLLCHPLNNFFLKMWRELAVVGSAWRDPPPSSDAP